MTHSRGPWAACNEGSCCCKTIWSKTDDHPVAEVTSGPWGDRYPALRFKDPDNPVEVEAYMKEFSYGEVPPDVAYANLRLIVAAPKLFEFVKKVHSLFSGSLRTEAADLIAEIDGIQD